MRNITYHKYMEACLAIFFKNASGSQSSKNYTRSFAWCSTQLRSQPTVDTNDVLATGPVVQESLYILLFNSTFVYLHAFVITGDIQNMCLQIRVTDSDYPLTEEVKEDFYVDDLLVGVTTREEAINKQWKTTTCSNEVDSRSESEHPVIRRCKPMFRRKIEP